MTIKRGRNINLEQVLSVGKNTQDTKRNVRKHEGTNKETWRNNERKDKKSNRLAGVALISIRWNEFLEERKKKKRERERVSRMKREKSCYTCAARAGGRRGWPDVDRQKWTGMHGLQPYEDDGRVQRKGQSEREKKRETEKGNDLERAEGTRRRPWKTRNETPGVLRTERRTFVGLF